MISNCQLRVLISYKILNVYATKSHLQVNQLKILFLQYLKIEVKKVSFSKIYYCKINTTRFHSFTDRQIPSVCD